MQGSVAAGIKINKHRKGENDMILVRKIQIPELPTQKPRRLYIYLPNGYEASQKRYPVVYMFVKDLPGEIFAPLTAAEFAPCVMEIISANEVDHRLTVKAMLAENGIKNRERGGNIPARFGRGSVFKVKFDDMGRAADITGGM